MLFNTFIHLEGIGEKNEIQLYKNNIHYWDDLLKIEKISFFSNEKLERLKDEIRESYKRYSEKDINYFLLRLKPKNAWRVYKEFKKFSCFLDIETDGRSGFDSEITVIGIYSENGYKCYVNGKNLEHFEDEILKYDMIITFNGRLFDFPVINRYFRTRYFKNIAHIDMKPVCNSMGNQFKGGLKNIERRIGLYRPPEIKDLDGYDAVKLWEGYLAGDKDCLDLLIEYNKYDVINLSKLADYIYQFGVNLMKERGLRLKEEEDDE
ncbi:MAG: ribonuclease H-like domain-containing protein [Deltaproteobacteria bacterium]|nr:ribonuclease H-like domain-containing protein [Deltaproteobacteria bacterium]